MFYCRTGLCIGPF